MKLLILKWLLGTTSLAAILNPIPVRDMGEWEYIAATSTPQVIERRVEVKVDADAVRRIGELEARVAALEKRPPERIIEKPTPSGVPSPSNIELKDRIDLIASKVGSLETATSRLYLLDTLQKQTKRLCLWIEGSVVIKPQLAVQDIPWCKEPWW